MNAPNRNDLLDLAQIRGDHLVSLYMPMHTGAEQRQNRVRYKNLLREAEAKLEARGVAKRAIRDRIDRTEQALEEHEVWQQPGRCLAVFIGPQNVRVWRPAIECVESCSVASDFHLLPLVASVNDEAPYYILAVSQNDVRLFAGTRSTTQQLEVPDLPTSRDEALGLDDPQPSRQQHSAQPSTPGKQGAVFHGQGGAPDAAKQEILAYFREIDRVVGELLRGRTEPLIFAGVNYLFPIYQEANRYPHLAQEAISGNPELWSADELRERAWPIVESSTEERREAAIARYGNSISAGQSIDHPKHIVLAAHAGAVDTLFVNLEAGQTAHFDEEALTVEIDEKPRDEHEALTNLAAALVLRNGGTVEPLDDGRVPGDGPMAAVLRYDFPRPAHLQTARAGRAAE